jgi:hypothetical protein
MPTAHITRRPEMTNATATTPATERPRTGPRVQLAVYVTDGAERRLLIGQRVDGVVRITDEPDGDYGTSYVVESHLSSKAELDALITDYLVNAKRIGYPPMHGWF